MTREIKFRAWDGGMMCTGFGVSAINGMAVTREAVGDYYDTITQPDWKVMQYTGLKDKNGTEVYEGDVLGYGKEKAPHKVQWDSVRGRWVWNNDFPFSVTELRKLEVIGNIYENPELIEKP
jgi:uncharacterized phage protein (TIGR01671 family)